LLYISTRSRTDSFTAHRALHEDCAPDGGLFIPFRLPVFTKEEIQSLQKKSFGECVAQILNLFFSTGLTGMEVDFIIGSCPVRIHMMSHRLIICELWRNVESSYSYLERSLYQKMSKTASKEPTDWAKIAIRIAVLFGLFAEMGRADIHEADIAVNTGDFSVPMAVWYARKMGLPVGMIICGCNENSALWDLIYHGEFNTGLAVVHTDLPELDHPCPRSLERLVYSVFGLQETLRYVTVSSGRGVYTLDEKQLPLLNDRMASAVVSGRRTRSVITSTYRAAGYIIDGYTAVAYGSLQDYRASTCESRRTLLLADNSPIHLETVISKLLGLSKEEFRKKL